MNNYVKSLASYIFKKMNDYQTDEQVRKEKPMLWPAGIYFTEQNTNVSLPTTVMDLQISFYWTSLN